MGLVEDLHFTCVLVRDVHGDPVCSVASLVILFGNRPKADWLAEAAAGKPSFRLMGLVTGPPGDANYGACGGSGTPSSPSRSC
jgi:hypothetical protein